MHMQVKRRTTMASAEAEPPYDRAWLVLLGASLCMFCGSPAVVYYTFGVFSTAVVAETHWSAAGIASVIAPGALIASIASPIIGRATDRFGVRAVAIAGGPAFAIGLILVGLMPSSARSFAAWTVVMYVLSFAGSPIPYAQALTGWFDKRRGMALSLMFSCGAIGIAFWPPFAAYLISRLGWRDAYVVMGGSAGTMTMLSGLLLLRTPPKTAYSSAAKGGSSGIPVREAVRTGRFWKIATIFMLLSGVLAGAAVNFPVILRQHGAPPQLAASAMTVIGMSMLLGRLSLSVVLDRWFAPRITAGIAVVPTLAFLLVIVTSTKLALFAAAGFLGFGLGSEYAIAAYIVSRAFGTRSFGALYGLIQVATNIGAAAGPATIGVCLALHVGTTAIFSSAIAVLLVAIGILLSFHRHELPFGGVVPITRVSPGAAATAA